jgi:hypothetical protein
VSGEVSCTNWLYASILFNIMSSMCTAIIMPNVYLDDIDICDSLMRPLTMAT